jgi:hypothetical protein
MTGCETRFENFSRKGKSHGQHNFDSHRCRRAFCCSAWRSGSAPPHSRQVTLAKKFIERRRRTGRTPLEAGSVLGLKTPALRRQAIPGTIEG